MDSSAEKATKHLKKVEDASAPSGLRYNVGKLKYLTSKSCAEEPVLCGDSVLKRVETAEYLGAMLLFTKDEIRGRKKNTCKTLKIHF